MNPQLEPLEDRNYPSFLLAGTVQQFLVPPVSAAVVDMQQASGDLQLQFNLLASFSPPNNTPQGAVTTFGRMVGDWQRVLSDRAAVQAVVATDTLFIQAAAQATANEGDPIDRLVLQFGPLFGINPLAPLNNLAAQANAIASNPQSQFIVNSNLLAFNPLVQTPAPIATLTTPVSFFAPFPVPFPFM